MTSNTTQIYGDWTPRALVETVEDLQRRIESLEDELKEVRAIAENNSTSDLEYKMQEVLSHLDMDGV